MEDKIIVGNIKMNMKYGEITNYINLLKQINDKNVIVCPSYIYIPYFLNHNFSVGSQNVCAYDNGLYTGEVSASQLSSIGVSYTIIGHSERRLKLNETDIEINKKVKTSLDSNIGVILCIGETLEEYRMLKKDFCIRKQLRDGLSGIKNLDNVIIAYEPVWSIGTSNIPSIKELIDTIKYIKKIVFDYYKKSDIKVIYGGSINENNIDKYKDIKELDGFLIGGASINPNQFIEIIKKVK